MSEKTQAQIDAEFREARSVSNRALKRERKLKKKTQQLALNNNDNNNNNNNNNNNDDNNNKNNNKKGTKRGHASTTSSRDNDDDDDDDDEDDNQATDSNNNKNNNNNNNSNTAKGKEDTTTTTTPTNESKSEEEQPVLSNKAKKRELKRRMQLERESIEGAAKPEETKHKRVRPTSSVVGVGTIVPRIFVGNLPFSVCDSDISSLFSSSCGAIKGIHYVTDKSSGKFYGTCFVDFEDPKAAEKAVRMHQPKIKDRELKVNWASGDNRVTSFRYNSKASATSSVYCPSLVNALSVKPEGCTSVFLGNLSFDITEAIIRTLFDDCTSISEVRWVERDGVFKGCGFVEFAEPDEVDKAVKKNGATVLGRTIKVDYAPKKEPR